MKKIKPLNVVLVEPTHDELIKKLTNKEQFYGMKVTKIEAGNYRIRYMSKIYQVIKRTDTKNKTVWNITSLYGRLRGIPRTRPTLRECKQFLIDQNK